MKAKGMETLSPARLVRWATPYVAEGFSPTSDNHYNVTRRAGALRYLRWQFMEQGPETQITEPDRDCRRTEWQRSACPPPGARGLPGERPPRRHRRARPGAWYAPE